VILILPLFVGAEINTDEFGSIPSADADSYTPHLRCSRSKAKSLDVCWFHFINWSADPESGRCYWI